MTRKFYITGVLFFLVPSIAHALTISASDSVAGLGTDVLIEGAEPQSTVSVSITPPFGPAQEEDLSTDETGSASWYVSGHETELAGTYEVSAGQQVVSFDVLPDSLSTQQSVLQLSSDRIAPDGRDEVEVLVIARDRYGNELQGRPFQIISSRSADQITALDGESNSAGEQRFLLSTREPGEIALRAVDMISSKILSSDITLTAGSAVGGSAQDQRPLYGNVQQAPMNPFMASMPYVIMQQPYVAPQQQAQGYGFNQAPTRQSTAQRRLFGPGRSPFAAQVSYGLVDRFEVSAPAELNVNEDATIVITAVDSAGNRVEDYTGLVLVSSTDPQAFLPLAGEVNFEPRNLGEKVLTLGLRFKTADEHILYVEDSVDSTIFGETTVSVLGPTNAEPGGRPIQITAPEEDALFNTTNVTVEGQTEPFINLIVSGGIEDVIGESDIDGKFAIDVELDPTLEEHVLHVEDEFGQMTSPEVTVQLDVTPPEITAITFNPETPVEETDVLLLVDTEPDLAAINVSFNGEVLTMVQGTTRGQYQILLKAPEAGAYDATVTVEDSQGNIGTESASLFVELKGLEQIQGLVAVPDNNAVNLSWDPSVDEDITGYRIYVGETPTEFQFTLDTSSSVTSAQVAGLRPGTDYFFAVTALQDERESEQRSTVAKATVLGVRFDIATEDSALNLDWSTMQVDVPLSSFMLEYGVEPEVFSEQRILHGDIRTHTMRDLLNDVTYFIRLTPISVTGTRLEDFIANAEGTPSTEIAGFHPVDAEPVPFTVGTSVSANIIPPVQVDPTIPPENVHSGAPQTQPTGLPSTLVWFALAASIIGIGTYLKRRRQRMVVGFLDAIQTQYGVVSN